MKNSRVILFFAVIIVSVACKRNKIDPATDDYFVKFFGSAFQDESAQVLQLSDGGYMLIGTQTNMDTNGNAGDKDMLLVKTDSYGNREWSKTYGVSDYDEEGASFCVTESGGYYLVGNTTFPNANIGTYVLEVDGQGNVLFDSVYQVYNQTVINKIAPKSNGGLLMGGYFVTGAGDKTGFFAKIESDRAITHSSRGQEGNDDEVVDIVEYTDGFGVKKFLAAINYGSDETVPGNQLSIAVLESDKFGLEGSYLLSSPIWAGNSYIGGLTVYNDTTLYATGYINEGINTKKLILHKIIFDTQKKFTGKDLITFDNTGMSVSGEEIIVDNNGDLIISGQFGQQAFVSKLSTAGEEIWKLTFGQELDKVNSTVQTNDGGYISTGSTLFENTSMMTLVKITADGKLQ